MAKPSLAFDKIHSCLWQHHAARISVAGGPRCGTPGEWRVNVRNPPGRQRADEVPEVVPFHTKAAAMRFAKKLVKERMQAAMRDPRARSWILG